MARKRFHNLKRPRIRQDWSRWTLYSLANLREPRFNTETFFKQKWTAKALTRAYHGNQVREQKWQLMFDRRLPAVVPMSASRLGNTDGSKQSAGRGAGIEQSPDAKANRKAQPTPYMHMTYWPVERRLDTAVWRALFASSALQARQFVVHGSVKVNGKKIRHPGYLLNPGDMFSVDPERVMYATGARKFDKNLPDTKQGMRPTEDDRSAVVEKDLDDDAETAEDGEGTREVDAKAEAEEAETTEAAAAATNKDHKATLKLLIKQAKDILDDPKEKGKLSGKKKQAMRAFTRQVRSTMSRIRGESDTLKTEQGEAPVADTVAELQTAMETLVGSAPASGASDAEEADAIVPSRDAALIREALDLATPSSGSKDASKPYATPWRPREFMSAFAFIPRYLEVHHRICSAVYLRHPVARPGRAEVPTPYSDTIYQLAHNWYLRRR